MKYEHGYALWHMEEARKLLAGRYGRPCDSSAVIDHLCRALLWVAPRAEVHFPAEESVTEELIPAAPTVDEDGQL